MAPLIRILPYQAADGPASMALDEAMLDAVAAEGAPALFRTYGWVAPTLSLGYFQRLADARDDRRWVSVPVVRRPTGGGAILHDHELTYAVAIARDHPLARRSHDLYRAVHGAFAALLTEHGLAAGRRGDLISREKEQARPFLCFTDRDVEDIVANGSKIVGSAQRRRSGAVLQHGSMMIRRSAVTPELEGAGDLAPVPTDPLHWSALVNRRVPEALGLRSESGPFPVEILQRARALERDVYRNEVWTHKR
jgi:lipoate-protein ligase A